MKPKPNKKDLLTLIVEHRRLRDQGVTTLYQMLFLMCVAHSGGISAKELKEAMSISNGGLHKTAEQLEKMKLITITRHRITRLPNGQLLPKTSYDLTDHGAAILEPQLARFQQTKDLATS